MMLRTDDRFATDSDSLAGKPVLVVFGEDWGGHPSSTQHLVSELSAQYRVVWVNSIGLRRPRLSWHDLARAWRKLRAFLEPKARSNEDEIEPSNPGFTVVNPLALPCPKSGWARRFNGWLLSRQIRAHLQPNDKVLLWCSLPSAVDVVGRLGESAVVYYCGDDFSALAGVDHDSVEVMEHELLTKSDHVFTASSALTRRVQSEVGVSKCSFVPHGVDTKLFGRAEARPADLPEGKPIAGFYGALADWIDLDLLHALCLRRPDWDFVFIGPELVNCDALKALPNTKFLGVKPHKALAAYVQHWQVSLVPFKHCAQIEACNPLKLREYLAAGTAVLSTDFPALELYREGVRVMNDVEQASAHMDEILAQEFQHHPDKKLLRTSEYFRLRRERQALVTSESWQVRAQRVAMVLAMITGYDNVIEWQEKTVGKADHVRSAEAMKAGAA